MFDYFYGYNDYGYKYFFYFLSFILIFSFILIVILGVITPYIFYSESKDKNYKKKIFFRIYEASTNILFFLYIVLISINILIGVLIVIFGNEEGWFLIIFSFIIGGIGIFIVYGIFNALQKIYSRKEDDNDNNYII